MDLLAVDAACACRQLLTDSLASSLQEPQQGTSRKCVTGSVTHSLQGAVGGTQHAGTKICEVISLRQIRLCVTGCLVCSSSATPDGALWPLFSHERHVDTVEGAACTCTLLQLKSTQLRCALNINRQ
jgi:hypothetical protein